MVEQESEDKVAFCRTVLRVEQHAIEVRRLFCRSSSMRLRIAVVDMAEVFLELAPKKARANYLRNLGTV